LIVVVVVLAMTACGKKGGPLPPLVRMPRPPAELTATRRGDMVDLRFNVPDANTDGSRPANVQRVDIYAFTGPDVKDEDLVKRQPTIGSVTVKAPKDPDAVVEEDESAADIEPAQGAGLEQGAKARVEETLTARSLAPLEIANKKRAKKPAPVADVPRPLLGAPLEIPSRAYVGVSVGTHGRKGPLTPRVRVPLIPAPPPPSSPVVTYDETTITLRWQPAEGMARMQEPATGDLLPSRLVGYLQPSVGYNVYEVGAAASTAESRLTASPVSEPTYADKRLTWGAERCYAVRAVEKIGDLAVESGAAPRVCTTLVDTFPPAPPKGLQSVATEGAVSLIWQANGEKDLAGYIVLRGTTPDALAPLTKAPIHETAFKDEVAPGSHYFYAVKALDKAGNVSGPSNTEEATAR
jgi:predicted small lipoprotein YifL